MIFEKQIINVYRSMAYTRCDDNGTAYYFSKKDFPGLLAEPHVFNSSLGHKLSGYVYSYEGADENRLIVFDHGFGGGHLSYMKEIEMLCRHGYRVFAYDHTGCMESGGKDPNGMAQSLRDLDDCIKYIKSRDELKCKSLSVIGHSWGGFSTLNISYIHPDITHVVVLSGFVSVKRLINSFFGGLLSFFRKPIMELERTSNPYYVDFDATESLSKSSAKALLIYSDNDKMCTKRAQYDTLCSALSGKSNVKLKLVGGKGHNPNYTADAVRYLGEYVSEKTRLAKKGLLNTEDEKKAFVNSFDWDRMTKQDESVWKTIFEHLDN